MPGEDAFQRALEAGMLAGAQPAQSREDCPHHPMRAGAERIGWLTGFNLGRMELTAKGGMR